MEIAFISDIHTDFYIKPNLEGVKFDKKMDDFIENELRLKKADILIFAGDNSHYLQQNKLMLEKISQKKMYKKIFITFGNHDMYLVSNSQKSKYKTSWNKILELKKICEEIEDIEFLDGNIIEVDGIKIGGCGMWYDFSYGKLIYNLNHFHMIQRWKETMTDAKLISGLRLIPELNDSRYITMYNGFGNKQQLYTFDPISFFNSEEKKMKKIIEECDIFISHIGPVVPKSLPIEHQNPNTGFYYFNGEYLLKKEKAPKLWIWGHTHTKYKFKINNTWLMCNPLGYKSEKLMNKIEVVNLKELSKK